MCEKEETVNMTIHPVVENKKMRTLIVRLTDEDIEEFFKEDHKAQITSIDPEKKRDTIKAFVKGLIGGKDMRGHPKFIQSIKHKLIKEMINAVFIGGENGN